MRNLISPRAAVALAVGCTCLLAAGCSSGPVKVANPDYVAWAAFAPGSTVTFEGVQKTDAGKQRLRLTETLLAKDAEKVVLARTIQPLGGRKLAPPKVRKRAELARIDPADHPATHPEARITELGEKDLQIAGKTVRCVVREVQVHAKLDDFVATEQDVRIRVHRSDAVPGGLVRAHLWTQSDGGTFEVSGQVVTYRAIREDRR